LIEAGLVRRTVLAVLEHQERADQASAAGLSVAELERALELEPIRRAIESAARRLHTMLTSIEKNAPDRNHCARCLKFDCLTSEQQNRRLAELIAKVQGERSERSDHLGEVIARNRRRRAGEFARESQEPELQAHQIPDRGEAAQQAPQDDPGDSNA
jgi:hypothetical protein